KPLIACDSAGDGNGWGKSCDRLSLPEPDEVARLTARSWKEGAKPSSVRQYLRLECLPPKKRYELEGGRHSPVPPKLPPGHGHRQAQSS
ncbi:hypothetical protein JZ751_029854, partial [Albula glossodonta]